MVFLTYLHAELFMLWLFTCIFIKVFFPMCFCTLCTNDTLAIAKGLKGTALFELL